jgi:hypothetical protein
LSGIVVGAASRIDHLLRDVPGNKENVEAQHRTDRPFTSDALSSGCLTEIARIEEGGREILVGVLILAVYLHGAVGSGTVGRLHHSPAWRTLPAALPVIHTMGSPLGERFAQLPGGFFFIWTLLTTGATGLVAFVLSVQAIWSLRQRPRASA